MVRLLLIFCVLSPACSQESPVLLAANPPSLDFDSLPAPAPASGVRIEFTNVGKTTTPLLYLTVTGDVGGAISVVENDCQGSILVPGGECAIYVTLDYGRSGSFAGTLNLSGNEVPISGTVAPPALAIAPLANLEQSAYQGDGLGPPPGPWQFSITNIASGTTGPLTVSVTDPFSASGCDTMLANGESCQLYVSYLNDVPLDAVPGDIAGTVSVHAAPGGDVSANLTLQVLQSGTFQLSDAGFGSIGVNIPVSQTVTLTNPGPETAESVTVTLALDASNPSPEPNSIFIADDGCSYSLAPIPPGGSCTVRLVANLASEVPYGGTLTATARNSHPASARVTATGVRDYYTVTVQVSGDGTGWVYCDPSGHGAPGTYVMAGSTVKIPNGGNVNFTAEVGPGSTFGGWSGASTSTSSPIAFTEPDNSDVSLTATFGKPP